MTSLLDFIVSNKSKLSSSWKKKLEGMNVWDDVEPIYNITNKKNSDYNGNLILSFIVLAYDNQSEYIEIHKDRKDNKARIIRSLAGLSAMTDPLIKEVIDRLNTEANKVIDWYIDFQKDWRWTTILTCFEYHSKVMQMKPSSNAQMAKETLDIGKCIDEAIKRRREGEKLLNEIKKEFVNLDSALEKEGVDKITSKTDFMSHEQYIDRLERK